MVTTGAASSVTTAGATLSGSFSGMTDVRDYGFRWGTSASSLTNETGLNSTTKTSGSYTVSISSLAAGTTYYYRAYVVDFNAGTILGEVKSFKTSSGQGDDTYRPYVQNYEMPAINFKSGTKYVSGSETNGGYLYYSNQTTNSRQMVVTHTYKYNNKVYRNYTCLVDGDKQAPLWSAFVMHKDAYPDKNAGRNNGWKNDPAVPEDWQQDSSGSTGGETYNRGHFVASSYRQTSDDANKQTFYRTNQALQVGNNFNGLIWNDVEKQVISNAPSGRDTLYVVVGILYEGTPKYLDGVQIPSHFYKLLMQCGFNSSGEMTSAKGVAYLFKNQSYSKTDDYNNYATTIDAVESRSGFDFFANVPSQFQEAAEKQSSPWF